MQTIFCKSSHRSHIPVFLDAGSKPLKYRNNEWKGKKAGRYDGAKECRHIVPTGNKMERE